MTALTKWCKGSVSRHIIAVLGLTVIDLPLFLLSFKIYTLILSGCIPARLLDWANLLYVIPILLVGNLSSVAAGTEGGRKEQSKVKSLLMLALFDIAVCLLSLLPIASTEPWGIALWFAYILAFSFALFALYECIDKSAMKHFDSDR